MTLKAAIKDARCALLLLLLFLLSGCADEAEETAPDCAESSATIQGEATLPKLGPADAALSLVVFSDFECPYCGAFAETLHQVHSAYPEELVIRFAHFPLNKDCNPALSSSFHVDACLAAYGASCAQDQGAFWEMHDALFAHFGEGKSLDQAALVRLSGALSLDEAVFEACLSLPETHQRVRGEVEAGLAFGATGTPTFKLGTARCSGAYSFEALEQKVKEAL